MLQYSINSKPCEPLFLIWTRAAKKKGLTWLTIDGILEHSWPHLDVEDAEAAVSLYNICKVYAVAMQATLQLKVSHYVVINSPEFGAKWSQAIFLQDTITRGD